MMNSVSKLRILVGLLLSLTLMQSARAARFDDLFESEAADLAHRMSTEQTWAPFRGLPRPLVNFLITEKLHMNLEATPRVYVDAGGMPQGGYQHAYTYQNDQYHPSVLAPFRVKGFWIPLEKGASYFNQAIPFDLPVLRKNAQGETEVLFLVHPKSEFLFEPLMAAYASQQVEISVLSLSSFRTLLAAIPNEENGWTYSMIKVSLDESINHINRTLSRKETLGSVAISHLFNKKANTLSTLEDVFSFVPDQQFLAAGHEFKVKGAGMIVRKIPPFLLDPKSHLRLIPLYSLLGMKNLNVLETMVAESGLRPTEFVVEKLLRPYARLYLDLLFRKNISIEVHGQNMLLLIDAETGLPVEGQEFVYRDMGGVNLLLKESELNELPPGLGHTREEKESFFYFKNYVKDAGTSIEDHFVNQVLFPFTRQFMQSHCFGLNDPEFTRWKMEEVRTGRQANWLSPESKNNTSLPTVSEFKNYGYFENKFGEVLVDELENLGILRAIPFKDQGRFILEWFREGLNNPLPTQSFKELIQRLLQTVSPEDL